MICADVCPRYGHLNVSIPLNPTSPHTHSNQASGCTNCRYASVRRRLACTRTTARRSATNRPRCCRPRSKACSRTKADLCRLYNADARAARHQLCNCTAERRIPSYRRRCCSDLTVACKRRSTCCCCRYAALRAPHSAGCTRATADTEGYSNKLGSLPMRPTIREELQGITIHGSKAFIERISSIHLGETSFGGQQ